MRLSLRRFLSEFAGACVQATRAANRTAIAVAEAESQRDVRLRLTDDVDLVAPGLAVQPSEVMRPESWEFEVEGFLEQGESGLDVVVKRRLLRSGSPIRVKVVMGRGQPLEVLEVGRERALDEFKRNGERHGSADEQ